MRLPRTDRCAAGRIGIAVRDGLGAGLVGALLSGGPSTLHSLRSGSGVFDAARAAGSLAGRPTITRGVLVHIGVSLWWGVVLGVVLPGRTPGRCAGWGALGGLGIAALDLGVIGRTRPAIRALPGGPQVLDHLVFGIMVGASIGHRRRRRRVAI
jgi:hypothetical protein